MLAELAGVLEAETVAALDVDDLEVRVAMAQVQHDLDRTLAAAHYRDPLQLALLR